MDSRGLFPHHNILLQSHTGLYRRLIVFSTLLEPVRFGLIILFGVEQTKHEQFEDPSGQEYSLAVLLLPLKDDDTIIFGEPT